MDMTTFWGSPGVICAFWLLAHIQGPPSWLSGFSSTASSPRVEGTLIDSGGEFVQRGLARCSLDILRCGGRVVGPNGPQPPAEVLQPPTVGDEVCASCQYYNVSFVSGRENARVVPGGGAYVSPS